MSVLSTGSSGDESSRPGCSFAAGTAAHWLAAAALLALAAPAEAQEGTLDRAQDLARSGRVTEARELVALWWELEAPAASPTELQLGLWLRGKLTVDPDEAALDFARLMEEYPEGPYSALAALRMAQAAEARGEDSAAVRLYETLVREYPTTDQAVLAQAWLEANGVGPDAPAGPSAPEKLRYAVQVGAYLSETRARRTLERIQEAGLEGRIVLVPRSSLFRVRLGRFDAARAADSLRAQVASRGFEAIVATDAHRERPVS